MSPKVAKILKQYAIKVMPAVVKQKYPAMVSQLQRWLKRWWGEMSAKEREAFRKIAEAGKPLPERLKKLARDKNLIVEWPPRPKPKAKPRPRSSWSKPNSWRTNHYRRFNR